jgi:hypothetical protein
VRQSLPKKFWACKSDASPVAVPLVHTELYLDSSITVKVVPLLSYHSNLSLRS